MQVKDELEQKLRANFIRALNMINNIQSLLMEKKLPVALNNCF